MMRAALTALFVPLALLGCSTNDDATTITVSAAASLTDAFTEIGAAFEEQHPDVAIRFNFAGSSSLAEQINAGAPVDVFAAASPAAMERTTTAGMTTDPTAFATNSMAIVTPIANPAGIASLADLENPKATVLICDAPVPCGVAASALFDKNGLEVEPASLEPDVRAVLTKVAEDEADAGIVYQSDIAANTNVTGIEIPAEQNVSTDYRIARTTAATAQAQDFITFVLSSEGAEILESWGFGSP